MNLVARKVIKEIFFNWLGGSQMSSVEYFVKTGHASGSFLQALEKIFEAGKQERDSKTLEVLKEVMSYLGDRSTWKEGEEIIGYKVEYRIKELENLSK